MVRKAQEIPLLRHETEWWNSGRVTDNRVRLFIRRAYLAIKRRVGPGQRGRRIPCPQDALHWTFSLSVRDWRYVVRIANVPKLLVEHVAGECPTLGTESPSPSSSAGHPLCALLAQALNLIPAHEGVRLAFYGNCDVATALNLLRAEPRNTNLSGKKTESRPDVLFFNCIPFRRVDALTWGKKEIQ